MIASRINIFILLATIILISASSCHKTAVEGPIDLTDSTQAEKSPDPAPGDDNETPPPSPPASSDKTLNVGSANGQNLVIDGERMSLDCQTTILIKGGSYSSITIRNINKDAGCPITISNDGIVSLTGTRAEMRLSNLDNVVITGDISGGNAKGFSFSNNNYRAIVMEGKISNLTISNMRFTNISDYVISYNNEVVYDGTPGTFSDKLRFLNLDCENSGPFIHLTGRKNGGSIIGLYRSLEIAYVNYRNSPSPGNIISIPNAEDFDIHHNIITNVNTRNNNHNAMFQIHGNGNFYNNYISEHQGNAIRSRPFSFGSTPKEVLIYNNIVINSRKYSAFEVQSFSEDFVSGKTTIANVKVYNNTCGNLNLSRDWYGVVLDAYDLKGGKCEVFNNLSFNMPAPHPRSAIVSYMGLDMANISEDANLYYANSSAAGIIDEKELKLNSHSPAKNAGIKNELIKTDFYGQSRHTSTPSVGAVE